MDRNEETGQQVGRHVIFLDGIRIGGRELECRPWNIADIRYTPVKKIYLCLILRRRLRRSLRYRIVVVRARALEVRCSFWLPFQFASNSN